MPHQVILSFLTVFVSVFAPGAYAAKVAFAEIHDENGKVIQLEPGGRFAHVAVKVGHRWLHAHPETGVAVIRNIKPYGDRWVILENPDVPDPCPMSVLLWVGKPFDYSYVWGNPDANYCARIVADELGVPPDAVMNFAADVWKLHYYKPEGTPGKSPDTLFADLLRRRFVEVADCEKELRTW